MPKKKKILLVGDSISANVDLKALEDVTKAKFVSTRAYSSVYDDVENAAKHKAKYPSSNFAKVVPAELSKDDYQTVILQSGSVDITNLNTKDEPLKYLDYFKQQTVLSAQRFFKTGEKALSDKPLLEKVILMKQTPRYDPASVDPLSIKPALVDLYNNTLTEQWLCSKYKDKIIVGTHNIECTGAIRESRYRVTKTGKFDGIHLFRNSGKKCYTNSVINILKFSQLTCDEYNYHLTCPQAKQQQQYRHRQQAQTGRGRDNNVSTDQMTSSIPMKNRFEALSGLNQGNC